MAGNCGQPLGPEDGLWPTASKKPRTRSQNHKEVDLAGNHMSLTEDPKLQKGMQPG